MKENPQDHFVGRVAQKSSGARSVIELYSVNTLVSMDFHEMQSCFTRSNALY